MDEPIAKVWAVATPSRQAVLSRSVHSNHAPITAAIARGATEIAARIGRDSSFQLCASNRMIPPPINNAPTMLNKTIAQRFVVLPAISGSP